MNLLLATVGATWAVVPELIAFTNPESVPLFADHPEREAHRAARERWRIEPVDAVWVVTTKGARVRQGIAELERWMAALPAAPALRCFTMTGVAELATVQECRHMQELIFRAALQARRATDEAGGKLYLSLAGGRKTMSADLQLAAEHFGCDLMLHVVDTGSLAPRLRQPVAGDLLAALPADEAAALNPIVARGPMPARSLFQLPEARLEPERYPLDAPESPPSTDLVERCETVLRQADDLMRNFTTHLLRGDEQSNFHALYSLPPASIQRLKDQRIGIEPDQAGDDLDWLRSIPKTELHCHLGGVLTASATLAVARAHHEEVEALARRVPGFARWLADLEPYSDRPIDAVARDLAPGGWKRRRDQWGPQARHLATSALIARALGSPQRIDAYVFGELLEEPARFRSIGIERYEALGDLQGSSLLQSETALRLAASHVVETCRQENILYCEIRCSPLNCVLGGLSPTRVVEILLQALASEATRFKLIFIASRHGDEQAIRDSIQLALDLRARDADAFHDWFAGFDLAGAEHARSPGQVRQLFQPALEACLNVTIHAGEGEAPQNIWEAVYELNADRVGHGLTLGERPDLAQRLRQRRVAIELCPSSNDQIVGFRDRRDPASARRHEYPLANYLGQGLRVTVNTDDPAMSRTTLSQEYLKAAWMCPQGLSRWQVLQIARNGFKAAFLGPGERKELLLAAESQILHSLARQTDS